MQRSLRVLVIATCLLTFAASTAEASKDDDLIAAAFAHDADRVRALLAKGADPDVHCEVGIPGEDVRVVEVHVEVESHLEEPTLVEVQDQVPISADANVRVRLMKTEPRDARLDDVSGVLTFELHLGPKGRADVMLTYEIESPKDYAISEALHS
ncbi:MAG: DUF4139 domain-containing protein [Deltaproteobacteria bacterium]|jgi:hypothetical protein